MSAGIPLTDADREKWLKKLREIIVRALAKNEFSALTCSALKEKCRDELAAGDSRVKFVFLSGSKDLIEERLKYRRDHFMPSSLLDSQFAILEPLADVLVFSCAQSPKKIIAELVQVLGISVAS
jgi:gluconokinase